MAFIPDNISVHVHLLEDNDPIKKQRWLLSAGFFSLADFYHKNNKSVSAKITTGLSLSILSAEKGQNFFKLWSAITFFCSNSKLQRQQCISLERCICIDI